MEGGGSINLQEKNVDSSTSDQEVTPGSGYDGLSKVTVNKYTLDTKTVDPSTSSQTVNSSADGLSSVTVNAVTSSIDGNIQAGNIKKDITILGVTGTYESTPVQPVLQDVSVNYSQNGSYTLEASSGYDGLGTVDIDVSVASQGGSDWVMEAKAGTLTDLSPYHVGYDILSKEYAMYMMFIGTNITNIPNIDSSFINNYGMSFCFQNCNSITSISFPNLVSVNNRGMSTCFYNSGITSASFPELTTVGAAGLMQCFERCTNLTSISFPKLTSVTFGSFQSCFDGCANLQNVEINPAVIDIISGVTSITDLTLTATVTDNLNVSTLPNLTADSVLNIIEHLSLSVSGKTVTFYTNGLTVQDDAQGSIQAAYDAAVAAGWTIQNLTIVQP